VNKKDKKSHKNISENMDWDDLAIMIIEIESELADLKCFDKSKAISEYTEDLKEVLSIYEKEKKSRIGFFKNGKIPHDLVYGLDYVSDWNHEDEDY